MLPPEKTISARPFTLIEPMKISVNVGAGVITVNYDGKKKHQTTIEDGAFIGSDVQLIAPVTVGKGAYVAAGSSITEDVPARSLAIGRGKQVNKEGWVDRKKS